jgi:KipI family sensor histidine kinase inhibitor
MRFSALGDSAIVAECGDGISPQTLQRVRDFANAVLEASLPGVTDVVPAFATVAVFYEPTKIPGATAEAFPHLLRTLEKLAAELKSGQRPAASQENAHEIPVCYAEDFGPDLPEVARHAGLSAEAVIKLHSEAEYLVYAIGFSPGFPYLGGLPKALETPRLATPRTRVEAGSVGIGGAQTGIYPLATPGGWRLIGRTPIPLFDLARAKSSLLSIGDRVKFRSITAEEFRSTAAAAGAGNNHGPAYGGGGVGVRVLRAGAMTTVQDLGRVGHRAEGIPLSGAVDSVALRVANWLVGNSGNAAALEFTMIGTELEFTADVLIALGGATFSGFPSWQPVHVTAGTRLKFGNAVNGCRGYLAVAGGFKVEKVLGSSSTCLRAGFGGFAGRPLRDGDGLCWDGHSRQLVGGWRIDERVLPQYSPAPIVRVVRGEHADGFLEELLSTEVTVTPRSDRMGLRLTGGSGQVRKIDELISTAVAPGTIQMPPDGQPILLLADAQTIGGYPQIAHVIAVDLPLVAQLKPGDRFRFREVSLQEAQRLLGAREHALAVLHEGLTQKFR